MESFSGKSSLATPCYLIFTCKILDESNSSKHPCNIYKEKERGGIGPAAWEREENYLASKGKKRVLVEKDLASSALVYKEGFGLVA